jgi:hypothetical protein
MLSKRRGYWGIMIAGCHQPLFMRFFDRSGLEKFVTTFLVTAKSETKAKVNFGEIFNVRMST